METRNYNYRFACRIELSSDYVIIVRMFFSTLNVLETSCHLPWDYFAGLSSHVWPIEIPMQKTSSKFGESWKKNIDCLPACCLICLMMLTHSERNINFIIYLGFKPGVFQDHLSLWTFGFPILLTLYSVHKQDTTRCDCHLWARFDILSGFWWRNVVFMSLCHAAPAQS